MGEEKTIKNGIKTILKWLPKFKKNEQGSLNPHRLNGVKPLEAKREAELRGLYYDCKNIMDLLNELDRRDEIIREQDRELWVLINKGSNWNRDNLL